MKFGIWFTALLLTVSAFGEDTVTAPPNALQNYAGTPDSSFTWQRVTTVDHKGGRIHQLRVTSQTWHDIVWKHAVEVYEPRTIRYPKHALLFVTGGSTPEPPDNGDIKLGLKLAQMCGARVVLLHQVPNQPLFGGRKEDDLISDTWLKYLETGDETWPLLFPMVKSAVSTMTAVQELSKAEWDTPIEHFVITGASKRGWTSWLTPVVDKRIIATAPIVIDVLNFRAQMSHQLDSWGRFSEQIIDYTSKGLVKRPGETESPRELALRQMMDPYTYRRQLPLPKLLIVGTNDRYWVVDAMNLYWDELIGQKYIRQVPNAGHGLDGGRDGALTTLAVFFSHAAGGLEMPEVSWTFKQSDNDLSLNMKSQPSAAKVRLWQAHSADTDFRDDKWTSTDVSITDGAAVGTVTAPESGHVAIYGEFEFDYGGHPWSLTTLVYRR